jgi:uracil DNA glycosylase
LLNTRGKNNLKKRKFENTYDNLNLIWDYDWLKFIGACMNEVKSEHHYYWKQINTSFDIMTEINHLIDDDFVLSGLRSIDFSQEHVVCISKDFIFDSNFPHALSFSKQNLDIVCPPGFKCIFKGYHFNKGINKKRKYAK